MVIWTTTDKDNKWIMLKLALNFQLQFKKLKRQWWQSIWTVFVSVASVYQRHSEHFKMRRRQVRFHNVLFLIHGFNETWDSRNTIDTQNQTTTDRGIVSKLTSCPLCQVKGTWKTPKLRQDRNYLTLCFVSLSLVSRQGSLQNTVISNDSILDNLRTSGSFW